jgi:hypothetical protein
MASRGKAKNYTNRTPAKKANSSMKITPEQARTGMLRVMSGLWALGAGGWTIYFSALGFGTLFGGHPILEAFGAFIAFGVVFFQLYFYQGYTSNRTFLGLSALAMIYSLWSTWAGLMGYMGEITIQNLSANPDVALVLLFFAVLIDWTAEPAGMFAIFGEPGLHVADAVGAIWDMIIPGDQSNLYNKRKFTSPFKKKPAPQASTYTQSNKSIQSAKELQHKLNGGG